VFVAPLPLPAEASLWDDLWFNSNQQAQRALEEGSPADAAALFEDTEWRGVARYRAGDYRGSATEFDDAGDPRNLYNLGNAMAQQGEFDAAIDAYEEVLEMEPDNADARYNLDFVKNLKDQQEQEQQQQGDDQQENPGGEGEQSDSDSQQQEGLENSQQGQQQQNSDGQQREEDMSEEDLQALQEELQRAAEQAEDQDPQQLSEEQLAELRQQQEQEQAMEQWLRRIPDDPGGLLRRKFRYQYQRYGKDQEGRDLWPDDEVQPW
jgi:Ca-activated chloride channel family protein